MPVLLLLLFVAILKGESWLALNEKGNDLREKGLCRQAAPVLTNAVSAATKQLGANHPSTVLTINNLGAAYLCLGEFTRAEEHFRDAVALLDANPPSDLKAGVLSNLGILLVRLSRLNEAEQFVTQALSVYETLHGRNHPQTAVAVTSLGVLRLRAGDYAQARDLFRRALEVWESSLGPDHPSTATALSNLGVVNLYLGNYEEARELTTRALDIRRRLLPAFHPDIAQSLYNHAVALDKLGYRKPAKDAFRQAASIRKSHSTENLLGVTIDIHSLRKSQKGHR